MAVISVLARLVNGVQRNVDLSANTLDLDNIRIRMGSGNASNYASFSGTLTAARTITMPDANVNLGHIANLNTLSGVSAGDVDLGTFTGTIIPDSSTIKGALQSIETALGSVASDTKDIKVSANDTTPGYLEAKIVAANGTNPTNILEISTLNDGADEDLQIKFDQSKVDHGSITGLGDDDHTQYHTDARGDARYYQKSEFVTTASAGAPVKLDGSGKIAAAQLPSAVMTYEGVWNASTNSPTLADGVGDVGQVYRVTVAGSQNLGSGAIDFAVGDYAILNSSLVWEKSDTTDAVASVNGATGVVTVNAINQLTGDITAGPASGSQSVAATIANGAVTNAKLGADAVDATKIADNAVNAEHVRLQNDTYLRARNAADSADVDIAKVDASDKIIFGGQAELASFSTLPSASGDVLVKAHISNFETIVQQRDVLGVALSATAALRWGRTADGATGKLFKADNDATSNDNFYVVGIYSPNHGLNTMLNAGIDDFSYIVKHGLCAGAGTGWTEGLPVYLGANGALTQTAPTAANSAIVKVGIAKTTTDLDVQIQIMGVN